MKRSAGVLLSVSSLPSEYGIGSFSKSAYEFVDFLIASGQTYWQILPLGPTGFGDSPYQSFSTFAGNPYFISLDDLIAEGLLTKEECEAVDFGNNSTAVDYEKLYNNRFPLLFKAYGRSRISKLKEFQQFCEKNEWLEDYALFMAIKDSYGGKSFFEWDEDIRLRRKEAIEKYRAELSDRVMFYKFLQFNFFKQWLNLKSYANKNGIKIIGDIPIYVAADSADCWVNKELFQLDENNFPKAVAGCPPDGFSKDGQLWGNPLYDWDYHEKTGFEWWISRLRQSFMLYDVVRIDHFRGFDEYYSVPFGEKTAVSGKWEKGPGIKLFKAVFDRLGKKEFIAEDLGFVTDSVKRLVRHCRIPNMKVFQFGFDERDTSGGSDHRPHSYEKNSVCYTGTHDNQTSVSWFCGISDEEKKSVRRYICDFYTPDEKLNIPFIGAVMSSKSQLCVIPMQDWLGLDDSSRMNIPSSASGNWQWRLKKGQLSDKLCEAMLETTRIFGRNS